VLLAPSQSSPAARERGRKAASTVIAGVASLALAVVAVTLGGSASTAGTFLLFIVSLPWTIAVYVLTMVFNVTSPIAIGAVLVIVTIGAWLAIKRLLVRTVC
jgi:hypothetical protein